MATLPNLSISISSIHQSSSSNPSKSHFTNKLSIPFIPNKPKPLFSNLSHKQTRFKIRATETNNEEENPTIPTTIESSEQQQEQQQEILGEEIKKAMKEREKTEDSPGFLSGVVEEIGQIEWPEFGKVVGITGVVLGVIAGSSVVLLTVNAVLAELSDQVFAGKGVQDFFGG